MLLGPNGAGKTTTIEILEGFRRPSGGRVEVLGADPLHVDEAWRARIGIVLQSWRDHARWTPRALLDHLGAYYRPFATADRPRPVATQEVIDLVGLGAAADQRIITLSGGQRRGWHEFVIGLRSPSDQLFYVLFGVGSLALLWFNREQDLGVAGLTLPQLVLPSILAALVMFSIVITPAYALALEREDGTVLRLRVGPYGLHGYLVGLMTLTLVGILPLLVIVLGGSALLFDGAVPADPVRWAAIVAVLLLGILANLPLGFVIGSLVTKLQQVTTWGMAPIIGLAYLSGIFGDMDRLWGWVQILAQVFPLYWFGHLMRFAFLPEAAAVGELTGSWRLGTAVAVLAVWTVAGFALAIPLVRRMSRRQSGAAVAEARDQAANQFVR